MSAATRALPPRPPVPRLLQPVLFWRFKIPFFAWCRRRCGDRFTIWAPPFGDLVCLADPADIKQVYTADPDLVSVSTAYGELFKPVMGERSLFLLDGREHLERRKLLLPAFHGEALQRSRDLIGEIAAAEVASWPVGRRVRLAGAMERIALDVVFRAVFGVDDPARLEELRRRLSPVITPGLITQAAWVLPVLKRFGPAKRYLDTVAAADELLHGEIRRRRADPELATRLDVLSMLIRGGMTDAELRDELVTLLIAGHETTAMGLAWTFERLLRHPAALERLRAELHEQPGGGPYLDAVVKEALRVRPVIMDGARRLTADADIAGHRLPKGTAVATAIAAVQHHEGHWDDPLAFRPERFLDGAPAPYTWIPFGGGTRRCVGAALATVEMKVVIETVLTSVELTAPRPRGERGKLKHITLVPARGAQAVVTRRLRTTVAGWPPPSSSARSATASSPSPMPSAASSRASPASSGRPSSSASSPSSPT